MSLLLLTVTLRGYLISINIAYCLFFHSHTSVRTTIAKIYAFILEMLHLDNMMPLVSLRVRRSQKLILV